jgi:hypothetical protein
MLKATEKHTQARNSERSDGVRGIVDTDTPKMTAQTLVNELVSVLYPCHSDVRLYFPKRLVENIAKPIDMMRTTHISVDRNLIYDRTRYIPAESCGEVAIGEVE